MRPPRWFEVAILSGVMAVAGVLIGQLASGAGVSWIDRGTKQRIEALRISTQGALEEVEQALRAACSPPSIPEYPKPRWGRRR